VESEIGATLVRTSQVSGMNLLLSDMYESRTWERYEGSRNGSLLRPPSCVAYDTHDLAGTKSGHHTGANNEAVTNRVSFLKKHLPQSDETPVRVTHSNCRSTTINQTSEEMNPIK